MSTIFQTLQSDTTVALAATGLAWTYPAAAPTLRVVSLGMLAVRGRDETCAFARSQQIVSLW